MEGGTLHGVRTSIKSSRHDWKDELRKNCLRRIQKERVKLLWRMRADGRRSSDVKVAEPAVRSIVCDELQKIKCSMYSEDKNVDTLWEYDESFSASPCGTAEGEDLLLEMERLLYEDLRQEMCGRELDILDAEDAYLAQACLEHMQLNEKENAKVWCPVCKQGELKENFHLVCCSRCSLCLDLGDEKVKLEYVRTRLAEVHLEHLDRGCRAAPKFCVQAKFGLSALYIQCEDCNTFDIVV